MFDVFGNLVGLFWKLFEVWDDVGVGYFWVWRGRKFRIMGFLVLFLVDVVVYCCCFCFGYVGLLFVMDGDVDVELGWIDFEYVDYCMGGMVFFFCVVGSWLFIVVLICGFWLVLGLVLFMFIVLLL